ncbi:hypothetical protein GQ600_19757 [Phytophthora cactorum]|nr:hypothetical protein GQ600_19757 [Phytophthora cactorum]
MITILYEAYLPATQDNNANVLPSSGCVVFAAGAAALENGIRLGETFEDPTAKDSRIWTSLQLVKLCGPSRSALASASTLSALT